MADPQTSAVLEAWFLTRMHEGSPPFSGGVLDAWPSLMVDGLGVCRHEERAVNDYLQHLAMKE